MVSARPRPVSKPVDGCFRRRTAASPPGPSTVLRKSMWSYCEDTHEVSLSIAIRSAPGSDGASREFAESACRWSRSAGALRGRSYSGASCSSAFAGTSARTCPPCSSSTRSRPVSVTIPMTFARISQRSAIASTASRFPGSTMASMRSWDSEVITSKGCIPGSR